MIGVYRIKNLINGKCYYGSSKNIEKRFSRHKKELINKIHGNCILQRAWDKYGENSFIFEVVEECELDTLLQLEQKYLNKDAEYNIGIKSNGGDNLTKNPNKDEIIKKITESVQKRYGTMSDEERKEKHSKPMESNPNWKGGISICYCEICNKKISQGSKRCFDHVEYNRNGLNNSFFGRSHTEESKKKIGESRKGRKPANAKEISINGKVYESIDSASLSTGIKSTTIWHRLNSQSKKYRDYKYL